LKPKQAGFTFSPPDEHKKLSLAIIAWSDATTDPR